MFDKRKNDFELKEASVISLLVKFRHNEKSRKTWIKECRHLIETPAQKQLVSLLLGEKTSSDPDIWESTKIRFEKIIARNNKGKRHAKI